MSVNVGPVAPEPACGNCRFFAPFRLAAGHGGGCCRRFPVTAAKHEGDWCSEHRPAGYDTETKPWTDALRTKGAT